MHEFLSARWFEAANRLLDDVRISPASSCRIQFETEKARFVLVIDDGRPVRFEAGELDGPDVLLRFELGDASRIWRGELRDDDAMRATTVIARTSDGALYSGRPAPDDLPSRPELDALPSIPGASVLVAYTFSGGPFGVVHHWLRFEDAKLTGGGIGETDRPDVRIGAPYWCIPFVRSGERTILDAIEGGTIEGELGPLALIAGIMESPAFRAAELATGRQGFALAVLGELWSHPVWVAALDQLARETAPL